MTLVVLVSITVYVLNQRPDPGIWHEVDLDEEFTADSDVADFEAYLRLENRLFQQLENEVYDQTPDAEPGTINRYRKGSLMDPTSMATNWNRTFVLRHDRPTAGVLLLHGMSDSPYSLRHLGQAFHASGASVVGLRLPGHGTAPSGLIETTWEDMAAAVRLAAQYLHDLVEGQALYLVGYSNGGALAVIHALDALNDSSLPQASGLVLISPEIGVSPAAAFAVWQGRIGHWLGFEKLAWNSISKEYDPFKYCSFAVNAADQAHQVTAEIDQRLTANPVDDFPPVLAFQSAVDATVSTPALISRLFNRLPAGDHELVLFGLNRVEVTDHLLARDPAEEIAALLSEPRDSFSLTVLSNARSGEGSHRREVVLRHRPAGEKEATSEESGLTWPDHVFSLSHIALPFPEDDPLYGHGNGGEIPTLGNRALRGERGTLVISPAEMLRQRWNPFYHWMEEKSLTFMKLEQSSPPEEDRNCPPDRPDLLHTE